MLTAAHCGVSTANQVVLGDHRLSDGVSTDGVRKTVSQVFTHPNYGSTNGPPENDFQLIKLAEPVEFTQKISSVCLPESVDTFDNEECVVTGWGLDEINNQGNGLPNELLQAKIPTMTNQQCSNAGWGSYISDVMICAGNSRSGACNGDSGGPLVCKSSEGNWKLAGVVSWGISGCSPDRTPSVFARTSTALGWIEGVMAEN